MDKLKINNINIYKSFRRCSHTIESAIAEFVDNSVSAFTNENNKTIIIYWNYDEKWLQIIDNANGIPKEKVNDLFKVFTSQNQSTFGLKTAGFFLGNKITVESKNTQSNFAFKTQFDLEKDVDDVPILYVKPDEVLRNFTTATRVTIDNIDKTLTENKIFNIYKNLSRIFKNYINKNINILFALLKDKCLYDIYNGTLNKVHSLNEVKRMSYTLPEHNEALTINYAKQIIFNGNKIDLNFEAIKFLIDDKHSGIMFSNEKRLIIGMEKLYKPDWFNELFKNVLVDVTIKNLPLNITKNLFMWDDALLETINQIIFGKIQVLGNKILKKTQSLTDSTSTRKLFYSDESEDEHLNTSKIYLTKALNNGTNNFGNEFEIIKNKLQFVYNCDDGKKIMIKLSRKKDKNSDDWLQLFPITQDDVEQYYEYEVIYNIAHPFFRPFDNDRNFSHQMEHFIIAYSISETICRLDGLKVTDLKYEISKLLKGMDDDF